MQNTASPIKYDEWEILVCTEDNFTEIKKTMDLTWPQRHTMVENGYTISEIIKEFPAIIEYNGHMVNIFVK